MYLDELINFIEKINIKDYQSEEITKFKLSLLLNKCNCYNNLKEYPSTVKICKEIIEKDGKCIKEYYYLSIALHA